MAVLLRKTPGLSDYGDADVGLIARDRELIRRCLHHEPGAWNDFVDRFLGLVYHVVQHTADMRSYPLKPEDKEDLAAQVLLHIVENDYASLKQFRGHSSLAAYLTVIARRTCVQEIARRATAAEAQSRAGNNAPREEADEAPRGKPGLETVEEVGRLLKKLPSRERNVVRMFYLEGRSYEEISTKLNIPVNSIGAILSRARKKLRGEA
jgi:RNA polymerase sigma-70 factor, ECF subfamily